MKSSSSEFFKGLLSSSLLNLSLRTIAFILSWSMRMAGVLIKKLDCTKIGAKNLTPKKFSATWLR
jgi:hypothetical protein